MFGYISINRPELKVRDHEEYQAWYCGLCHSLRRRSGIRGQLTLTYDMTFLAILLAGLYEDSPRETFSRCPTRPWRRMRKLTCPHTDYAADMNVLLAAYNLEDDWLDDHSLKGLLLFRLLRRQCRRIERQYPRQSKAVQTYLAELHRLEASRSPEPDAASGLTGRMLGEIFVCKEDEWSEDLRDLGYALGQFIYLMDAFEDYEEDLADGSYNPWCLMYPEKLPEETVFASLTLVMSRAARAFERMPILMHADILRNILYSGVWGGFNRVKAQRHPREDSADPPGCEGRPPASPGRAGRPGDLLSRKKPTQEQHP